MINTDLPSDYFNIKIEGKHDKKVSDLRGLN